MAKENELVALVILILLITACVWVFPNAPVYGAMLGLSVAGILWGFYTGRKTVLLISFYAFSLALCMLII